MRVVALLGVLLLLPLASAERVATRLRSKSRMHSKQTSRSHAALGASSAHRLGIRSHAGVAMTGPIDDAKQAIKDAELLGHAEEAKMNEIVSNVDHQLSINLASQSATAVQSAMQAASPEANSLVAFAADVTPKETADAAGSGLEHALEKLKILNAQVTMTTASPKQASTSAPSDALTDASAAAALGVSLADPISGPPQIKLPAGISNSASSMNLDDDLKSVSAIAATTGVWTPEGTSSDDVTYTGPSPVDLVVASDDANSGSLPTDDTTTLAPVSKVMPAAATSDAASDDDSSSDDSSSDVNKDVPSHNKGSNGNDGSSNSVSSLFTAKKTKADFMTKNTGAVQKTEPAPVPSQKESQPMQLTSTSATVTDSSQDNEKTAVGKAKEAAFKKMQAEGNDSWQKIVGDDVQQKATPKLSAEQEVSKAFKKTADDEVSKALQSTDEDQGSESADDEDSSDDDTQSNVSPTSSPKAATATTTPQAMLAESKAEDSDGDSDSATDSEDANADDDSQSIKTAVTTSTPATFADAPSNPDTKPLSTEQNDTPSSNSPTKTSSDSDDEDEDSDQDDKDDVESDKTHLSASSTVDTSTEKDTGDKSDEEEDDDDDDDEQKSNWNSVFSAIKTENSNAMPAQNKPSNWGAVQEPVEHASTTQDESDSDDNYAEDRSTAESSHHKVEAPTEASRSRVQALFAGSVKRGTTEVSDEEEDTGASKFQRDMEKRRSLVDSDRNRLESINQFQSIHQHRRSPPQPSTPESFAASVARAAKQSDHQEFNQVSDSDSDDDSEDDSDDDENDEEQKAVSSALSSRSKDQEEFKEDSFQEASHLVGATSRFRRVGANGLWEAHGAWSGPDKDALSKYKPSALQSKIWSMHSHSEVPKRFNQANLWSRPAGAQHDAGWPWNAHQEQNRPQLDQKDQYEEAQVNNDVSKFFDSQHAVTTDREQSPHRHEKGWLWNPPASSLDSSSSSSPGQSSLGSALWLRDRRQQQLAFKKPIAPHGIVNDGEASGDRFFRSRGGDEPSMLDSASSAFSNRPSNLNLLSHRKNSNAQSWQASNHAENQADDQADEEEDSDDGNRSSNSDGDQEDGGQDDDDDDDDPSSVPEASNGLWKSVWRARSYASSSDSQQRPAQASSTRQQVPLRNRLWEKN